MKIELTNDSWRWLVVVVGLTAMVTWFVTSIVLVAPDNQTRAASEQQQEGNPSASRDGQITVDGQGSTQETPPNWYSFLAESITVQWVLAFFTALTLLAVGAQAVATTRAVEQTDQHFVLLNSQWLDTGFFSLQAVPLQSPTEPPAGHSGYMWRLRFKIANQTERPVRILTIAVFIYSDGVLTAYRRAISPRTEKRPAFETVPIAVATLEALRRGERVNVHITGCVTYINAINRQARHYFCKQGPVVSMKQTRIKEDWIDPEARFKELHRTNPIPYHRDEQG